MKLPEITAVSGVLVVLICISASTDANILHDIKEIVKDIFADKDGDGNKKETERVQKTMAEWKTCLGVQLDKSELNHIMEDCDEEFEINEEKDAKKKSKVQLSACYRVCQLEHLGWLHDTDSEHTTGPYFNHTAMDAFIKATFPESVQKGLKTKISNCARRVESFSDEKACKNYKKFFTCLDKAIHHKCKKQRGSSKGKTTTEMTTTTEEEEATTEGGEETTNNADEAEK